MPKLRALVVDDAVVMRRLLTEALQRDHTIEVAATASNGRIALEKLARINPDVVTLDIEMPEMDGLATLRELRKTHPHLPVIVLSAYTQRGATETIAALAAGASDYLTKPSASANVEETLAQLEKELLPKVRALCQRQPAALPRPITTRPSRHPGLCPPVQLICIGTSTGGPNALVDLFQAFTAAPGVPIAIVQHMPPMFTRMLAARLDSLPGPVRCKEAAEGDILEPGCAYLAPGGVHLALARNATGRFVARLLDTAPENSCRPAVDVLFRTAANTPATILGVVLTGMGQDGLRGSEQVLEHDGQIIAQDQTSSVVWGMPGAVAQAGLAHVVLPLSGIAAEILHRSRTRLA
ncbi:MAG: chemotaxis response regulator protein-glutamate methylesterase [Opitutales bacterium]